MRDQHGTRRAWTGAALVTAVLAGLLQLVGIVGASPAWACSCADVPDSVHLKNADAVFTGRMMSWARWPNGTTTTTLFRTFRIYKGTPSEDIYVVSDTSSCGLRYDVPWWLVFASDRRRAGVTATVCGGSRSLPTQMPAVLGAGRKPVARSEFSEPPPEPEPGPDGFPRGYIAFWRSVAPDAPYWIPPVYVPDFVRGPVPWLAGGGVGLLLLAMPTWLAVRMRRLRPLHAEQADEARIRWVG